MKLEPELEPDRYRYRGHLETRSHPNPESLLFMNRRMDKLAIQDTEMNAKKMKIRKNTVQLADLFFIVIGDHLGIELLFGNVARPKRNRIETNVLGGNGILQYLYLAISTRFQSKHMVMGRSKLKFTECCWILSSLNFRADTIIATQNHEKKLST